ncbi:MAG: hypothetical protein AAF349_28620, partial [Cyanobacteria bacterium P01_A01_bin.68]
MCWLITPTFSYSSSHTEEIEEVVIKAGDNKPDGQDNDIINLGDTRSSEIIDDTQSSEIIDDTQSSEIIDDTQSSEIIDDTQSSEIIDDT